MQVKIVPGYEGGITIGQRKLWVFYATGPTSYLTATNDPVTFPTGMYIDSIQQCMDTTGIYEAVFYPSTTGTTRPTWTAYWITAATGAQVTNTTNLSAIKVQFLATGGDF